MPVTEFDDDITEQRPGRERDNSLLLTQLMVSLYQRRLHFGIGVFPCQDVRVSADCTHTADVCVTLGEPEEQVFTSPPFLCVEILSAFVPVAATLRKIADYLKMGVAHVWLMNPRKRTAIMYTPSDFSVPEDDILRTSNPDIALPLAELF